MFNRIFKSYDWSLIIVYFLLTIFGVIMVYSASMVITVQYYNYESSSFFFDKQVRNLLIASVAFIVTSLIPYKIYKNNKILGLIVVGSFIGLLLVLVIGSNVNNATSWLNIGSFRIQPSEVAKIGLIIYLAAVYAKKQPYINNFNRGVVPPLIILIFICALTAIQPDIGTAAIIFATGAIIIACSGMSIKTISKLIGIGLTFVVVCSPIIYLKRDAIFTENRIGRLISFTNPFEYEQGVGHQLVNSYLAIGQGGLTGVGLGKSVQKLGYLPEAHTDFIMAIIAEELGVFGVLFVIGLLGYIVLKGFYIGMKSKDPFGSLLAFGIAGLFGVQSFVNLGGVSGLIPITGVTLPLISYGGSSLILMSAALGILVNVSMFTNYDWKYKNTEGKVEKHKKIS